MMFLLCLSGCNGPAQNSPIIDSFTSNVYILEEGDSAILSWTVINATTITINPGGDVALSGSTSINPTSTTIYTLTAINNFGSTTAGVTITVNPVTTEHAITIQPGAGEGKDAMVMYGDNPDINYGSDPDLIIGNTSKEHYRSYLQFNLETLPVGAVIANADLKLYQYNTSGTEDLSVGLHLVTESWEENSINWSNQSHFGTVETKVSVIAGESTWISWDITSLLQEWLDGSHPNHGIVLCDEEEYTGETYFSYHSSDYTTDSLLRPKLEIIYYAE